MISQLRETNAEIDVYDPWVDPGEALREYGIELSGAPAAAAYDAILLTVAHKQFVGAEASLDLKSLLKPGGIIFDVKGRLEVDDHTFRL